MSTNPPPDPAPTPTDRKKLTGLGVFLAILAALVVLALIGFALWGSGEVPANP
jgi:hypothetical protein